MEELLKIVSVINKPSEYASCLGEQLMLLKHQGEKQKRGQYFTPLPLAAFMGSLAGSKKNHKSVKILDPGCGTAVLSCALIEHIVISSAVREIELTCYENDKMIIPSLNKSISFLAEWLRERNIKFTPVIFEKDFITENEDALSSLQSEEQHFDYIISNPPFFKVPQSNIKQGMATEILSEQPNTYFFFMLIAGRLLKENGNLIFLLPRSFCCGGYYKKFRDELLNLVKIDSVYQFNSSKEVFEDKGMLSDFVIVNCLKSKEHTTSYSIKTALINLPECREIYNYTFSFSKKENIIYLPKSDTDADTIKKINSYTSSLKKSNLEIRQGNVLRSKIKEFIIVEKSSNSVPYINAENIFTGEVNYVLVNDETSKLLIPNKNYILFTRYNTHRKYRLVAAVNLKNRFKNDSILIDKQLNYICANDSELNTGQAEKVADAINSDMLYNYIKIINGNINVTPDMLMDIPLLLDF